ncbi:MAG: hypothetical protein HEEMFOPI_00975 [Holosporales bacterium]
MFNRKITQTSCVLASLFYASFLISGTAPVALPATTTAAATPPSKPESTPSGAVVDNSKTMTISSSELDQPTISKEDAIKGIHDQKVIVTDPDSVSSLNTQPAISIYGLPYKWTMMDKGFALDPVVLSEKSGVICRFFKGNNAYVGNVYKDNDPVNKGAFICRAATDINNQVIKETVFQNLGSYKGVTTTWKPILSTNLKNWETGYTQFNVGDLVTEKDTSFKAPGICRTLKEGTTDEYHIGRAIMDGTTPHCYLKRGGFQVDLTPDELQKTEVMIRPSSVQDVPSTTLSTVVAPNFAAPTVVSATAGSTPVVAAIAAPAASVVASALTSPTGAVAPVVAAAAPAAVNTK